MDLFGFDGHCRPATIHCSDGRPPTLQEAMTRLAASTPREKEQVQRRTAETHAHMGGILGTSSLEGGTAKRWKCFLGIRCCHYEPDSKTKTRWDTKSVRLIPVNI